MFAAPRAGGIWDSVREDLATSASGQGGSLREVDGPFGPELAGTILATPPAQPGQAPPQPVRRPARFLGVDGPRWFLRGDDERPRGRPIPRPAAELEEAFRAIVVVRGNEPMPVREQLPLTLPAQAAAELARQQASRCRPAPGSPYRRLTAVRWRRDRDPFRRLVVADAAASHRGRPRDRRRGAARRGRERRLRAGELLPQGRAS